VANPDADTALAAAASSLVWALPALVRAAAALAAAFNALVSAAVALPAAAVGLCARPCRLCGPLSGQSRVSGCLSHQGARGHVSERTGPLRCYICQRTGALSLYVGLGGTDNCVKPGHGILGHVTGKLSRRLCGLGQFAIKLDLCRN
jgi:hypothetical protein